MDYALQAIDVTKSYGNFTLNAINLTLAQGKILGLVGENGAGKTTLISLLLNQIKRDAGSIMLLGRDNISCATACKADIGFVVDECCFHDCLNAQNVGKIMKPIYKKWSDKQYDTLLSLFRIEPKKKIAAFSKGTKSKLMLAVALAHRPELLILDEATSGLDPIIRDDILRVLKGYVDKTHASVLLSTHITSDLDKIADEIAFLHEGSLVFQKSKQALREDFNLVTCTKEDFAKLPSHVIQRVLIRSGLYTVLTCGQPPSILPQATTVPSIDDIMLLYINGKGVA